MGMMGPISKDAPNERVLYTYDNKIHFKRRDPFGFWYLNLDKGKIAEELSSAFTSLFEAQKAVSVWSKKNDQLISETPFEKPVLKTKETVKRNS